MFSSQKLFFGGLGTFNGKMAGSERQRNCSQSSLILVYWTLFASIDISDIIGFYGNVTNSQLCNVRFLFYQQKAMLILSNNSVLTKQEQGKALLAIQRQRMKVILQAKVVQCRILDHNHGRPDTFNFYINLTCLTVRLTNQV